MKQDPLALAFFGAALALLAALLLYVGFFRKPEPEPEPEPPPRLANSAPPAQTDAQKFHKSVTVAAPPAPAQVPAALEAGHSWRYRIDGTPPAGRNSSLTYRTQRESGGLGVVTDFVHPGGKMNFHLGIFAAGHPSHANTRFPGFFMYAAYLQPPFSIGKPVVIAWPWQSGRSLRPGPGRMKQFEGNVESWEEVQVEAGVFRAAKINGWLRYLEADGNQFTRVALMFWYAPDVGQVVKVLFEGAAPDEGGDHQLFIAELVEYR